MATDELNSDSRVFQASMRDGSRITYKAEWRGYMDYSWSESGGPSKWDHPFDDRRCHWSAAGRIVRSVAVVIAGQEYWHDDLTTAFQQGHTGQGSSFVLSQIQAENCGMAGPRRESDFQNMRDKVNRELPGVMEADLPNVIAMIRALPDIVELNV